MFTISLSIHPPCARPWRWSTPRQRWVISPFIWLLEARHDQDSARIMKHMASAHERMSKVQERQARNYDERHPADGCEVSDLVFVNSHALRGSQEVDQTEKFATCWLGSFAARSRVVVPACIVYLPVVWRFHHTIKSGFQKRCLKVS